MWVKRREIEKLSADIRRIIDGQSPDLRDNLEGRLSILKNDIHSLAGCLNEQAGNLLREKSAMADTLTDISHQLKTPLTAMMVMAELLENATPEKAAEFILNLKQCLARTGWLVNALLKMAKLESGSVVFSPGEITAGELFEVALQPLQILFDIKSQRVVWAGGENGAARGAGLLCDRHWTAEALTNILKNASEHSPEGGVITVDAGANPLCRWISVTDGGRGIPYGEMMGLFQRFKGAQGTGVGLPLALAILRGQHGDIEVDGGGGGKGATFTLKFFLH
ncbi:MAG: HAMP domain-containing histidine kinase [Defluviitaleaceae bacterium]|nr:HAMP domain-containing histidine kinase [Defluviitaleaceae bacterium]MCL2239802.1 HAMP domain-containing histidine kinase [Defluviitaleaceae bacterium]